MSDAPAALRDVSSPRRHTIEANGLPLAVWEWPGTGTPILLVHATGFHAQCWRQVIARLPGRQVFAVDMPNHGCSGKRPPPTVWEQLGADLAAVVAALGLQGAVAAGHSMGGYALTIAAAAWPDAFRRLLLIDPVICDPATERFAEDSSSVEQHPVARRRNDWVSAERMIEVFAAREPFLRWDPAVLRDYCEFGLLPRADGEGIELACPPELEAAVYLGMRMGRVFEAIRAIRIPVEIVRARPRTAEDSPFDFSPSPTWPELARQFSDATDCQLADCTHFIPMERPAWVAEHILAL